jgi:hypothetical protein
MILIVKEHIMAESSSLSRRTALAGLGAGSLGFVASRIATAGASVPAASLIDHPLTGLWLSHMALTAEGDQTAAVPAFFGADGTAVLVYPCAEASENGTQIRGLALGTWAAIDDHEAHFTAVQVCFGADGSYQGTRTYDGYPVVSDDGASFAVKNEFDLVTIRDAGNAIVASIAGGRRAMVGARMTPGNAGFAAFRVADGPENAPIDPVPAAPLDPNFPEGIAPLDPNDPRLMPTMDDPLESFGKPEGAPVQPGDLRNVP